MKKKVEFLTKKLRKNPDDFRLRENVLGMEAKLSNLVGLSKNELSIRIGEKMTN